MPTPTAGTASLISAPVPNPVPFTGAPNQQLLSGQYNSNFYAMWNYATLLATALNSCTYVPGAAIAGVSAAYPLTATVGSCSPGNGATLTLGVAHGDYDDLANAQTIAGAKTFSATATFNGSALFSGTTFYQSPTFTAGITLGSTASVSPGGVGTFTGVSSSGPITVGAASYIVRGTNATFPFLAGVYSYNAHTETGTTTLGGGAGQTYTFNFNTAFTATPNCTVGYNYNGALPNTWQPISFNKSLTQVKIFGQGSANVDYICMGY